MNEQNRHDVIRAALISDPVNIDRASVILGALQNAGWIVLPAEEVYGQMQRITKLEAALRERVAPGTERERAVGPANPANPVFVSEGCSNGPKAQPGTP
jgi:hypothetical protein